MEKQLTLVDTPKAWKLDRHTREIGRRGVANAREVLRRAGSGTPATGTNGARRTTHDVAA